MDPEEEVAFEKAHMGHKYSSKNAQEKSTESEDKVGDGAEPPQKNG